MPARLENVIMVHSVAPKSNQFQETANTKARVDFDVFGAKEIRDVLKSRTHCLRAGFPARHIIIATLNEIRNHYILKVGVPTYLSQMLGEAPIQYCTLYDLSDQALQLDLKHHQTQPLQRFIAQCFQWDELPFKVEVRKEDDPGRIEVRYL
jgi:hypothetical protein